VTTKYEYHDGGVWVFALIDGVPNYFCTYTPSKIAEMNYIEAHNLLVAGPQGLSYLPQNLNVETPIMLNSRMFTAFGIVGEELSRILEDNLKRVLSKVVTASSADLDNINRMKDKKGPIFNLV